MNKNNIIAAIVCFVVCLGCSPSQEIPTYNDLTDKRYVFFERRQTDSIETSFYLYGGQEEILLPVVVRCTGAGTKEGTFNISVVDDMTTAPAANYEIPQNPVMPTGVGSATYHIKLKKTALLDETKVRLVVEIRDTKDFLAGQTEFRRAIIWFHNIFAKPRWWDVNVTRLYLGTYSDKKYMLFLDVVGVDLAGKSASELRNYTLIFKKYLTDEKNAGRTVYETNGQEMVVPVLGNIV